MFISVFSVPKYLLTKRISRQVYGWDWEEVVSIFYEAAENRLGFRGDVMLTMIVFCEPMSFFQKRMGIKI